MQAEVHRAGVCAALFHGLASEVIVGLNDAQPLLSPLVQGRPQTPPVGITLLLLPSPPVSPAPLSAALLRDAAHRLAARDTERGGSASVRALLRQEGVRGFEIPPTQEEVPPLCHLWGGVASILSDIGHSVSSGSTSDAGVPASLARALDSLETRYSSLLGPIDACIEGGCVDRAGDDAAGESHMRMVVSFDREEAPATKRRSSDAAPITSNPLAALSQPKVMPPLPPVPVKEGTYTKAKETDREGEVDTALVLGPDTVTLPGLDMTTPVPPLALKLVNLCRGETMWGAGRDSPVTASLATLYRLLSGRGLEGDSDVSSPASPGCVAGVTADLSVIRRVTEGHAVRGHLPLGMQGFGQEMSDPESSDSPLFTARALSDMDALSLDTLCQGQAPWGVCRIPDVLAIPHSQQERDATRRETDCVLCVSAGATSAPPVHAMPHPLFLSQYSLLLQRLQRLVRDGSVKLHPSRAPGALSAAVTKALATDPVTPTSGVVSAVLGHLPDIAIVTGTVAVGSTLCFVTPSGTGHLDRAVSLEVTRRVSIIQAHFRGRKDRVEVDRQVVNIIKVQGMVRRFLANLKANKERAVKERERRRIAALAQWGRGVTVRNTQLARRTFLAMRDALVCASRADQQYRQHLMATTARECFAAWQAVSERHARGRAQGRRLSHRLVYRVLSVWRNEASALCAAKACAAMGVCDEEGHVCREQWGREVMLPLYLAVAAESALASETKRDAVTLGYMGERQAMRREDPRRQGLVVGADHEQTSLTGVVGVGAPLGYRSPSLSASASMVGCVGVGEGEVQTPKPRRIPRRDPSAVNPKSTIKTSLARQTLDRQATAMRLGETRVPLSEEGEGTTEARACAYPTQDTPTPLHRRVTKLQQRCDANRKAGRQLGRFEAQVNGAVYGGSGPIASTEGEREGGVEEQQERERELAEQWAEGRHLFVASGSASPEAEREKGEYERGPSVESSLYSLTAPLDSEGTCMDTYQSGVEAAGVEADAEEIGAESAEVPPDGIPAVADMAVDMPEHPETDADTDIHVEEGVLGSSEETAHVGGSVSAVQTDTPETHALDMNMDVDRGMDMDMGMGMGSQTTPSAQVASVTPDTSIHTPGAQQSQAAPSPMSPSHSLPSLSLYTREEQGMGHTSVGLSMGDLCSSEGISMLQTAPPVSGVIVPETQPMGSDRDGAVGVTLGETQNGVGSGIEGVGEVAQTERTGGLEGVLAGVRARANSYSPSPSPSLSMTQTGAPVSTPQQSASPVPSPLAVVPPPSATSPHMARIQYMLSLAQRRERGTRVAAPKVDTGSRAPPPSSLNGRERSSGRGRVGGQNINPQRACDPTPVSVSESGSVARRGAVRRASLGSARNGVRSPHIAQSMREHGIGTPTRDRSVVGGGKRDAVHHVPSVDAPVDSDSMSASEYVEALVRRTRQEVRRERGVLSGENASPSTMYVPRVAGSTREVERERAERRQVSRRATPYMGVTEAERAEFRRSRHGSLPGRPVSGVGVGDRTQGYQASGGVGGISRQTRDYVTPSVAAYAPQTPSAVSVATRRRASASPTVAYPMGHGVSGLAHASPSPHVPTPTRPHDLGQKGHFGYVPGACLGGEVPVAGVVSPGRKPKVSSYSSLHSTDRERHRERGVKGRGPARGAGSGYGQVHRAQTQRTQRRRSAPGPGASASPSASWYSANHSLAGD
ncbi:hypothetical protein KIPB_005576 [Kipferlia bialata]|uniref:Uncharacterized protein n=1 Tax=Kipferlia bialata TaxID=797122 RepID=A0A9K3GHH1_9EUKA|nr:hypothetical protein KIPB_005576 [Kipferlia bialata]|eukprot:g5576.t1